MKEAKRKKERKKFQRFSSTDKRKVRQADPISEFGTMSSFDPRISSLRLKGNVKSVAKEKGHYVTATGLREKEFVRCQRNW